MIPNEVTRSKPLALTSVDLHESRRTDLSSQFLHERIFERR
jgi:hypothetical protein